MSKKITKRMEQKMQKGDFPGYVGLLVQLKGGVCEVCGKEVEFSYQKKSGKGCVHHKSHDKWDLMVVCDACHRKLHQ